MDCQKDHKVHYYRARYYNPSTGRFLSEDPIGLRGGINFYGYVMNSPTNLVDPRGTDAGPTGPGGYPSDNAGGSSGGGSKADNKSCGKPKSKCQNGSGSAGSNVPAWQQDLQTMMETQHLLDAAGATVAGGALMVTGVTLTAWACFDLGGVACWAIATEVAPAFEAGGWYVMKTGATVVENQRNSGGDTTECQ